MYKQSFTGISRMDFMWLQVDSIEDVVSDGMYIHLLSQEPSHPLWPASISQSQWTIGLDQ